MSESQDRNQQALDIVKQYRLIAVGVGLIPVAFVDMAALAALQLKMLRDIAKLYEVKFIENIAQESIAALVSAGGLYGVNQLVKLLPVSGWLISFAGGGTFSAASTYAIGKVFIQHFDSGGTFLTFNPDKVKAYYTEQLESGKQIVPQKTYAGVKP